MCNSLLNTKSNIVILEKKCIHYIIMMMTDDSHGDTNIMMTVFTLVVSKLNILFYHFVEFRFDAFFSRWLFYVAIIIYTPSFFLISS